MALHICASGFGEEGEEWNGTYEQVLYDVYEKIPERNYSLIIITACIMLILLFSFF